MNQQADDQTIFSINNHMYFYSDVNPQSCAILMRELRLLDNMLHEEAQRMSRLSYTTQPHIYLHIMSDGGDVHSALAVYDQLSQLKSHVHSVIEGVCSSSGTIIAMGCAYRLIQKSSFVLIHQLRWGVFDTHENVKSHSKMADKLMDVIVDFYVAHSNLTKKKIKKLLKNESWFNAQACIDAGFANDFFRQNIKAPL